MKRTLLLLGFFFVYCIASADLYDKQYFNNAKTIQLDKAGTLSKALGKDLENITSLQIKGNMSDKDMKTLAKLTNLKNLNLRYAHIEQTKYFPTCQNLEVLFLPDNQLIPIEYLDMVPANVNLKVLMLYSTRYYTLTGGDRWGQNKVYQEYGFAPFTSLKKVIISGNTNNQQIEKNKGHGIPSNKPILIDTVIYLPQADVKLLGFFKARLYEGVNGHLFYISDENVDFATVEAVEMPKWHISYDQKGDVKERRRLRPIVPKKLDLKKMAYVGIGYFNDTEVEEITFYAPNLSFENKSADKNSQFVGVFNKAKNLKKITFASSIKNLVIPSYAFAECPNLETIIFNCPVTIESYAFFESNNVKKIVFNAMAKATINSRAFYRRDEYIKTPLVKEIIFNSEATIYEDAFPIVESIQFNVVPKTLDAHFSDCKNIKIPAIKGANEKFVNWGIPRQNIIDPLAGLTCDIVVLEPGNILNYLPFNKLEKIDSLTVTGHLYETDIAIIKQCTKLKYLNLANTYISESPSSQERREAENEMWAAMAQVAIADAQLKEATGEYKKREAKQQAAEAVLAAATMQARNPDMPDCYIPTRAFEKMLRLQEVILPSTLKQINAHAFDGCSSLQKVDLGNALEEINRGAFANTSLKKIKFPETLKSIHVEAFDNVKTLTTLDFANCTMTTTYGMIYDYYENHEIGCLPNVTTLYMPNGMKELNYIIDERECMHIKNLYVGKDVINIGIEIKDMNIFFQTEQAPEITWFGKVSNCVIYIPQTANITSYFAKFNNNGNRIVQR